MASHDGADLAGVLGIRPGMNVGVVNEPEGWLARLRLPDGVTLHERASEPLDVLVYFSDERANVARRVPVFAGFLAPDGALWMATPESASDLTRADVESIGTGAGLVAVGAAVLAEGWTAVRFERR
jgi:hypothetical protein